MKFLYRIACMTLLAFSTPAHAQLMNLSTPIPKDTPVEVTADKLSVMQKENQAIFTGNVVAVQGPMNLKADKMTVFYHNSDDKKATGNAVSRIVVEGNTLLTMPDKSASGTRGAYNVDKGEINILGNVVLKQGKNVLKGEKFVHYVNSGKSEMMSAARAGGTTVGTPTGTGRVKGVFIPSSSAKKPAPKK